MEGNYAIGKFYRSVATWGEIRIMFYSYYRLFIFGRNLFEYIKNYLGIFGV